VRVQQPEEDVEYSVLARGLDSEPQQDRAVLQDYFNLQTSLAELSCGWARQDPRFEAVAPFFPGLHLRLHDFVVELQNAVHCSRSQAFWEGPCCHCLSRGNNQLCCMKGQSQTLGRSCFPL